MLPRRLPGAADRGRGGRRDPQLHHVRDDQVPAPSAPRRRAGRAHAHRRRRHGQRARRQLHRPPGRPPRAGLRAPRCRDPGLLRAGDDASGAPGRRPAAGEEGRSGGGRRRSGDDHPHQPRTRREGRLLPGGRARAAADSLRPRDDGDRHLPALDGCAPRRLRARWRLARRPDAVCPAGLRLAPRGPCGPALPRLLRRQPHRPARVRLGARGPGPEPRLGPQRARAHQAPGPPRHAQHLPLLRVGPGHDPRPRLRHAAGRLGGRPLPGGHAGAGGGSRGRRVRGPGRARLADQLLPRVAALHLGGWRPGAGRQVCERGLLKLGPRRAGAAGGVRPRNESLGRRQGWHEASCQPGPWAPGCVRSPHDGLTVSCIIGLHTNQSDCN
mmetsp:Transcript_42493/g.126048  ORF Transcript_42493/g.126048 Transcript_42493/m.126048 type:complete len:384 (-) Transcript_42493:40-1191(-)